MRHKADKFKNGPYPKKEQASADFTPARPVFSCPTSGRTLLWDFSHCLNLDCRRRPGVSSRAVASHCEARPTIRWSFFHAGTLLSSISPAASIKRAPRDHPRHLASRFLPDAIRESIAGRMIREITAVNMLCPWPKNYPPESPTGQHETVIKFLRKSRVGTGAVRARNGRCPFPPTGVSGRRYAPRPAWI